MTIGTTISSVTVDGNGATVSFAYPFLIPAASDAVVLYTNVAGLQVTLPPTQFTISGIGLQTGGTVTYPLAGPPIASGATITIERVLPIIQDTSISNQGPTFSAIESEFDYLTMLIQQVNSIAERAIIVNPADLRGPLPLPIVALRALRFLFFDVNGDPTAASVLSGNAVVSAAMEPVVSASTVAIALALLGGVDSAQVAADIIAGVPAYLDSLPDNNTGLSSGDLFWNGGFLCKVS